jgi:hypothetical protein
MKVTSAQHRKVKSFGSRRVLTHLLLGGMTLALFLLIAILIPRGKQSIFLVIALGYLSLFLVFITLVLGPLNLLRLRRNPVNIDVRRDIGIWAGITGCLHVLLVIRGTVLNGQILLYFLQRGCCGYTPSTPRPKPPTNPLVPAKPTPSRSYALPSRTLTPSCDSICISSPWRSLS